MCDGYVPKDAILVRINASYNGFQKSIIFNPVSGVIDFENITPNSLQFPVFS